MFLRAALLAMILVSLSGCFSLDVDADGYISRDRISRSLYAVQMDGGEVDVFVDVGR